MSDDEHGLAAVVLAAGASVRMGRPKALVPWRGRPFVAHAIALARCAGADPIAVVEGAVPLPDPAIEGALRVVNAQWSRGPLTSLQAGLEVALAARPAGVLVLTVDRPHVAIATIEALALAWRNEPTRLWQPRYQGRHGHPILWPADLARRLSQLSPDDSARALVRSPDVASRRAFIDVQDGAVVDNLDRPEDLSRLE